MSKAEHMGASSSKVSSHAKTYSCPTQTTLENTHESSSEYKFGGHSEDRHKLECGIKQTEAEDSSAAVLQSGSGETVHPSTDDVTKSSLLDLDPPPEDVRSAPFDNYPRPMSTTMDQKLEPDAPSVNTACVHSESSKAIESSILLDESRNSNTKLSSCIANETSQASPEDIANNSCAEDAGLSLVEASNSELIDESSNSQQTTSGQTLEFPSDRACCKPLEERQKPGSELSENESVEIGTGLFSGIAIENLEPLTESVTKSCPIKHIDFPPGDVISIPANEQVRPSHDNESKHSDCHLEKPSGLVIGVTNQGRPSVKRTLKLSRKKYISSLRKSDRVLRSKSQEKPKAPESSNNSTNGNSTGEKKGRRRKKRRGKSIVADEYSRIRARLRYLLNRMSYERSLITAYSGEGWKGLSLEKLKPEKELQRATSEIIRQKVKIRDLFQHIDSLCGEGRFPASLFDSEGQIDSEDIFCAKCGSKDWTADNDIILCDGACDRGYHQFCLVPPLLREDIPPGDEGWLCPGCDCKVDCIDLLNESQGTNISISDSWENVFPEAAAAASGQKLDCNFGLSSDDSDDNDYDPDGLDIDEKSQEESSSDESDFGSASEEFEAPSDDKQFLGLPSDDSEDDDYDPDAPVLEEKLKQESSSSDFSSDSEDFAAILNDDGLSLGDEYLMPIKSHEDSKGRRLRFGGKKNCSLNSKLLSMLEPESRQDKSAVISGKRNIERLDYKKLYDVSASDLITYESGFLICGHGSFETYGNISTSSDDDYNDTVAPRKRRKNTGDVAMVIANGDASFTGNGMNNKNMNQELKKNEHTSVRISQKLSFQDTTVSPAKAHVGDIRSGSSSKRVRPSPYKKLGEAVTQKLYSFFKENQYPDQAAKTSLAEELGITFEQVNKWFMNARWSFNHSSPEGTSKAESASGKGSCDGHLRDSESKNQTRNKQKTSIRKSRR
ncbi:hypothetical protein SADUNF_Sadunf16G0180300 [Salix dunnii]|uniref:Uncharacterized protein n=1 Tax=Salix dunnii TaxID=1413687 RepID=A0A835JCR0_9ROSI|nr:hypothetical protein SADUNF_Sadunf16G0180300 [Salix dunnii]